MLPAFGGEVGANSKLCQDDATPPPLVQASTDTHLQVLEVILHEQN